MEDCGESIENRRNYAEFGRNETKIVEIIKKYHKF